MSKSLTGTMPRLDNSKQVEFRTPHPGTLTDGKGGQNLAQVVLCGDASKPVLRSHFPERLVENEFLHRFGFVRVGNHDAQFRHPVDRGFHNP